MAARKAAAKTTKTKEVAEEVVEETGTELAVTEGGEMVIPSFMSQGNEGTETIGQDDIEIPWLKLLQGTSPGLNENGWRPGNFLHSILEEEVIGADGLRITVILALQPRYMLFNPLDQGGGILARAEDGIHWTPSNHTFEVKINKGRDTVNWTTAPTVKASGLANWGSSDPANPNSPPAADLQYRYLCVSPDYPEFGVFMVSMQRSALRSAKRLNSFLMAARLPTYGQVFSFKSKWEDNGADDKKFVWVVKRDGLVQDEETYNENKELYDRFKDADVTVHDEGSMAGADAVTNTAATNDTNAGTADTGSDEY